jgi:two-component sensor histidine kinase
MENMLLRLLPKASHPVFVRYVASAGIVGVAALLRFSMDTQLQHYPLLLFFPAVFLCSLLFDRGSGFFATVLSAIVAAYLFISPHFSMRLDTGDVIALTIFVVVGFTMAGVTEALRKTIDQLARAHQSKALLLEELAHRTKNDLAIIGSAITLQARASGNDEVRAALDAANARVQVVAAAQSRLRTSDAGAAIELNDYLEELCSGLGDMLRGIRPIAVRVHCPPMSLPESTAVAVGLIVNELVTNSLKYAFPTDRGGIVEVEVTPREQGGLTIKVRDNGVGCAEDASGLGTRLVRLLAKQRGGWFERSSGEGGCESVAVVPDLS